MVRLFCFFEAQQQKSTSTSTKTAGAPPTTTTNNNINKQQQIKSDFNHSPFQRARVEGHGYRDQMFTGLSSYDVRLVSASARAVKTMTSVHRSTESTHSESSLSTVCSVSADQVFFIRFLRNTWRTYSELSLLLFC